MNRIRNGLLIIAIIALAACCTVRGTRDAHALMSKVGVEPVPQALNPNPDSGEPDAGSTRNPPKSAYRPSQTDRAGAVAKWDGEMLKWVAKVWITKYLGTGL